MIKRRIFLWGVIGVLFAVALLLTFKAGNVQATQLSGTISKSTVQTASAMVGGC